MADDGIKLVMTSKATLSGTAVRGERSWNYLYVFVAFVVSILGTIIQMIEPLKYPWNIAVFGVVIALALIALLNARVQNAIIALKEFYESRAY